MTHAPRLAAIAALSLTAAAAPALGQTGGPDAFGTLYMPTDYDFVPLLTQVGATATTIVGSGGQVVTLPFAFPFYGSTYSQAVVSAEGALSFTTSAVIPAANGCLPAVASGSPDIAIFWDDLNPLSGEIRTWHDSANGRFIVSWEGVAHAPNNGAASFQIHLYAIGGDIEFHYADVDFGNAVSNFGVSATIGIQDNAGGSILDGNFLQRSCNSGVLSDQMAIKFSSCADVDGDGFTDAACGGEDCDDAAASTNPDAPELCDGNDNDCDGGTTDEDADEDNDGQTPCEGDCDDGQVLVLTGGTEVCDGLDNDCVLGVDDPFDGDGDFIATCVGDCDDSNPTVYPGAPELCDGLDTNCDGELYNVYTTPDANQFTTANSFFRGAMFRPAAPTFLNTIAAWMDPMATFQSPRSVRWLVYEGANQTGEMVKIAEVAQEIPSAGVGWYVSPQVAVTMQPGMDYAVGLWWDGTLGYGYNSSPGFPVDVGWGSNIGGASSGPWTFPADSSDTLDTSTSYDIRVSTGGEGDFDADGDLACFDCDDTDSGTNSVAAEVCDGADNDCDGSVPPDEADGDQDGHLACVDDCDDGSADVFPDNPDGESCDGLDNDCDGALPDDELDGDGDGWVACAECDDGDPAISPDAAEICDGRDTDCSGGVPSDEADADNDGFRPCDGDCNDQASSAHPDNVSEGICTDNVDNDCDGDTDEEDADCGGGFDDDDDASGDDDDSAGGAGGCGGCKSELAGAHGASGVLGLVGLAVIVRRRR